MPHWNVKRQTYQLISNDAIDKFGYKNNRGLRF
jgi:hypothetical protein